VHGRESVCVAFLIIKLLLPQKLRKAKKKKKKKGKEKEKSISAIAFLFFKFFFNLLNLCCREGAFDCCAINLSL
jgi:hypothetical protein